MAGGGGGGVCVQQQQQPFAASAAPWTTTVARERMLWVESWAHSKREVTSSEKNNSKGSQVIARERGHSKRQVDR